MKLAMMLLTLVTFGWGGSYDPFLLDTQLSLLPKIAMLEKNLTQSPAKSPIKILIAYDSGDERTAETCSKILNTKFNGRLNGHPLSVTTLPFDKLDNSASYHLVYALKASLSQLKKVHNIAPGAVTALYDADKLGEDGLLFSVQMERTPIIMINAKALKENRFSFPDSLLEIARIVQ
ncbi:MAG: hypothetical protein PHW64_01490 [Sulfuricurvum sp.]|nr:hypothetical protein [Sulfuricurvum sp.]